MNRKNFIRSLQQLIMIATFVMVLLGNISKLHYTQIKEQETQNYFAVHAGDPAPTEEEIYNTDRQAEEDLGEAIKHRIPFIVIPYRLVYYIEANLLKAVDWKCEYSTTVKYISSINWMLIWGIVFLVTAWKYAKLTLEVRADAKKKAKERATEVDDGTLYRARSFFATMVMIPVSLFSAAFHWSIWVIFILLVILMLLETSRYKQHGGMLTRPRSERMEEKKKRKKVHWWEKIYLLSSLGDHIQEIYEMEHIAPSREEKKIPGFTDGLED